MTIKKYKAIIEFTSRDYELLASLYFLRLASTTQLKRLFFKKKESRYPYRRIRQLLDSGFLRIAKVAKSSAFNENLYELTNKGIESILYEITDNPYSDELKRLYYSAAENSVNERQHIHHLLTNDIYITLFCAGLWGDMSSLDVLLTQWFETRRALLELNGQNYKNKLKTYHLKPDAVFHHEGITYYVEVDRNTEPNTVVQAKMERYIQLKASGSLEGERQVVLFFCSDRVGRSRNQTLNRISLLRMLLIKSSESYLGPNFQVAIGPYDSLLDGLISKKTLGDPCRGLADTMEKKLRMEGYRVVIRDDYVPLKDYPYRSLLWLAFNDTDGENAKDRLRIRGIESFMEYDMKTWKRISEFPLFYERAMIDKAPFRPVLWLLVSSQDDIRNLIKQLPDLTKCTEFIVNNTFYKSDGAELWEVPYDVEV